MRKEVKRKINDNGSYTETFKIEQTPKDGAVPLQEMQPASKGLPTDNYGEYRIGYGRTVGFSTDDPRITRPAIAVFALIFFGIGIFFAFFIKTNDFFMKIFGLMFSGIGIFIFIKGNKEISELQREKKNKIDNYKNNSNI